MKSKNVIMSVLFAVIIMAMFLLFVFLPKSEFLESERRYAAKLPKFNYDSVISGEFTEDFETYAADNIPFREAFRHIKSVVVFDVLKKLDNNSLYIQDGHISKMEYPLNIRMQENAAEKFEYIYEKYLKNNDVKIYLSIVPDKNYYLAKDKYLSVDYEKLTEDFAKRCPYAEYIDITDTLSCDDYYKTDSHWRMERIIPAAKKLCETMGTDIEENHTVKTLERPFFGVYAGQIAMNVKPDTINYLTNKTIEEYIVTYYDSGKPKEGEVYNMQKAEGRDMYEMFLSGSTPLCVIENKNADTNKELILFRDSFGSSAAPILAEGYKKVTLIDIRYVQSDVLGELVDFEKGDVLFLYSTTLLNNSLAMR